MARRKKPIDYTPRYTDGYFRSADEVEQELIAAEDTEDTIVRTDERTNGSAPVPSRNKTRHSFDVYRDQVAALNQIQAELYSQTGKKPTLGDLVQEALDDFIAGYRNQVTD